MSENSSVNEEDEPLRKKPRRLVKRNEATIDEEEVRDLQNISTATTSKLDHESHADGDAGEGSADEKSEDDNDSYQQSYHYSGNFARSYEVSSDQLREAQDIFGEGMEDFEDEDLEGSADNTALVDESRKTSFEYIQLLQNFSLAEDEQIRTEDIPERYLTLYEGLVDVPETLEEDEASWIYRKMIQKNADYKLDLNREHTNDLKNDIPIILQLIHKEKLEIPVIWVYKRDYFSESLKRQQLWDIFWLDRKWRTILTEKQKALEMLQNLIGATPDDDVLDLKATIGHYRRAIEFEADEEIVRDAISFIGIISSRLPSNGPQAEGLDVPADHSKRKSSLFKYSHVPEVRQFLDALSHPAHIIGRAISTGIDLEPPSSTSETLLERGTRLLPNVFQYGIENINQLYSISMTTLATEIAHDPYVRKMTRDLFREGCTVTTAPTDKGMREITPFSQHFGLHIITRKPLSDFMDAKGLIFFMRLVEAEQMGLIKLFVNNPLLDQGERGSSSASASTSSSTFNLKFFDRMKLYQLFRSSVHPESDPFPESRKLLDTARMNLLSVIVDKHLVPLIVKDIREDLIRKGKEQILDEIATNFENLLSVGPYYDVSLAREFKAKLLLDCPNRPRCNSIAGLFVSSEFDSIDVVAIDKDASLVATAFMPSLNTIDWEEKLKLFLFQHRPSLIVINVSGGMKSERVKGVIEKKIMHEVNETIRVTAAMNAGKDDEEDNVPEKYSVQVIIIKDDLATLLRKSQRAKDLNRELESSTSAALCLARFAHEPLLEYCSLWRGVDSTHLFGFEACYLNLHPLQGMIKSHKKVLVQRLEMKLVQAVSDVGVDINLAARHPHYSIMLAFLPGLGLRKADKLVRDLRRTAETVETRYGMKGKQFKPIVWGNACGFIRISSEYSSRKHDPLDNTRIHPVCYSVYNFVTRICADAMDVESVPDSRTQLVSEVKTKVHRLLEKRLYREDDHGRNWRSLIEQINLGISVIGEGGFSKRFKELDDILEILDLEQYADEIELQQKGRRRLELELIKDELRYPWLDFRSTMQGLSHGDIAHIVSGESMYSLHVGLKVGFTVLEVIGTQVFDRRADQDQYHRHGKIVVKTDNNLRGYIFADDATDDRGDLDAEKLSRLFPIGSHHVGVVVGVNVDNMSLSVASKASLVNQSEGWWMRERKFSKDRRVRDWWQWCCDKRSVTVDRLFDRYFDEERALEIIEGYESNLKQSLQQIKAPAELSASAQKQTRVGPDQLISAVIFHPLFVRLDALGAEKKLREEGSVGSALVRPSSKGPNHLGLVWAFQENWFMHVSVEQTVNPADVNQPYFVVNHPSADRPYMDLDEMFSEYIGRMNDFVSTMTKHKSFHRGDAIDVENEMKEQVRQNPGRVPYFMRFEHDKPGTFALTWLDSSMSPRVMKILVSSLGFRVNKECFSTASEIIVWLKKVALQQPKPVAKRQSRFG